MKVKLLLVFLITLILRIHQLSTFPIGFHADEVRAGWNAYSILNTGKDDRGNTLALYYNTFGDYRPTGIIYLTIPSIIIFGLSEFAVRFPSALIGSLTIFPLYLFAREITRNKKIAIFASFLLAISPWHIGPSRSTSEVIVSIFLALFAMYYFVRASSSKNTKYFLVSFIFILISYFFYHSIRLLAPIFILSILFTKPTRKGVLVFLASCALTLIFTINPKSLERFSQIAVTKDTQTSVLGAQSSQSAPKRIFDEYMDYFSGDFLTRYEAKPVRYGTFGIGLITIAELFLTILGIAKIVQKKLPSLPLILLAISPLAAALTYEDSPNLHRSLFMLPFLAIIAAYGFFYLRQKYIFVSSVLFFLILANIFHFWHIYTVDNIDTTMTWRNYGAKELVVYLNEVQNNYEKVIVTNDPDDPYPWFAFFNRKNPGPFNKSAVNRVNGSWQFENVLFTQKECPSGDEFPGLKDLPSNRNILVVDGFRCAVESKINDGMQAKVLKQFNYPNGKTIYTLWVKN